MSRRTSILAAYVLALVATWEAWVHALAWIDPHPVAMAWWLPLIVITDAREGLAYLLCLLQFPLLATVFVLGLWKWRAWRVGVGLMAVYLGLVGVAFWVVRHGGSWR